MHCISHKVRAGGKSLKHLIFIPIRSSNYFSKLVLKQLQRSFFTWVQFICIAIERINYKKRKKKDDYSGHSSILSQTSLMIWDIEWQRYTWKRKRNPCSLNRSRTYDLPISQDTLSMSYRSPVEARLLNYRFLRQSSCILLGIEYRCVKYTMEEL